MGKIDFLLKNDFIIWLRNNGKTEGTIQNYLTWLNTNVKKEIASGLGTKLKPNDYLNNVCRFLLEGDVYIARSLVPTVYDTCVKKNCKSDYKSALRAFYQYICSNPDLSAIHEQYNRDELQKIREALFNQGRVRKINGNLSLINLFGTEENFIRKAVEESYFFSNKCVNDRFIEIAEADEKSILFKRDTPNKNKILPFNEGAYCHITQNDKDGNNEVRRIIKSYTRIKVSEGEHSTFENYIISHVWGKAGDPRYFTNFWNIVLIPAWANGPMDKNGNNDFVDIENENNKLSKKMQDTYKAICNELYNMKSFSWNDIKMNFSEIKTDGFADRIKGTYKINIIPHKKENNFAFNTQKVLKI